MIEFKGTCNRAACVVAILVVVMAAFNAMPALAQSEGAALGTYLPLGGLERFIGPIIPATGIASTFRSEVTAGVSGGNLVQARLVGTSYGQTDLKRAAFLDEGPLRYNAQANVRLWRLAFRAKYTNFQDSTRQQNFGQVDFTGLSLGGDLDAVQFPWLTLGASVDFYLLQPSFQGVVLAAASPSGPQDLTLTIQGQGPMTAGGYFRYVPPEILNIPLHIEAWFRVPIGGSQLKNYGGALVFRPQIYRFDVAAKAIVEKDYLKFKSYPQAGLQHSGALTSQDWEVDTEWNFLGGELVIYF